MADETATSWLIERLHRRHDRSRFDCGQPALNDWLRLRAGQFDRKDLARTYVGISPPDPAVLGYYAVLSHQVRYEALPPEPAKGLPKIDVPVILLGRLAVDRRMQGQGLGAMLLVDALQRAQLIAEQLGVRAVEVDALDDQARAFYLRFGFMPLLDDPNHLLLPMSAIRKLALPPLRNA